MFKEKLGPLRLFGLIAVDDFLRRKVFLNFNFLFSLLFSGVQGTWGVTWVRNASSEEESSDFYYEERKILYSISGKIIYSQFHRNRSIRFDCDSEGILTVESGYCISRSFVMEFKEVKFCNDTIQLWIPRGRTNRFTRAMY